MQTGNWWEKKGPALSRGDTRHHSADIQPHEYSVLTTPIYKLSLYSDLNYTPVSFPVRVLHQYDTLAFDEIRPESEKTDVY